MTDRPLAASPAPVRLCDRCEDYHFRPQPEQPAYACYRAGCECWCNTTDLGRIR